MGASAWRVDVLYSYGVEFMEDMMSLSRSLVALAIVLVCAGAPVAASDDFAIGLGDATGPLVAVGIAATYFGSGGNAHAKGARVADAAVIAFGTARLLKPNLRANGDSGAFLHSFPSGHTAVAFGAATALAELNPKHKWAYYAGAALLGWSRVESGAHSWKDVLGGAAVGFGAGKWSVSSQDGLMMGRVYRF